MENIITIKNKTVKIYFRGNKKFIKILAIFLENFLPDKF